MKWVSFRNSGGDDGEVDAPLWLALFILFAFTALTGALHCWMEGWDFGTAFYFQYVTYLTIGFGDVVPIDERVGYASTLDILYLVILISNRKLSCAIIICIIFYYYIYWSHIVINPWAHYSRYAIIHSVYQWVSSHKLTIILLFYTVCVRKYLPDLLWFGSPVRNTKSYRFKYLTSNAESVLHRETQRPRTEWCFSRVWWFRVWWRTG